MNAHSQSYKMLLKSNLFLKETTLENITSITSNNNNNNTNNILHKQSPIIWNQTISEKEKSILNKSCLNTTNLYINVIFSFFYLYLMLYTMSVFYMKNTLKYHSFKPEDTPIHNKYYMFRRHHDTKNWNFFKC